MIIPEKLKIGDEIRVIAPSRSLSLINEELITLAKQKLEDLGFKVTFSKNCRESNRYTSSSIKSRVEDIHTAFSDKDVKGILTVIGGFNVNQILSYLDYQLIKDNPKILCGYSDITALSNAITAKTGLVTYSGLHFSTWAMEREFEYNLEYFKRCLMENSPFEVTPSQSWSDDLWFLDQNRREVIKNDGYWVINRGEAEGRIFGGNLCTFNLLQGTEFMPDIRGSILFLEDDEFAGGCTDLEVDRNLQSLIHLKDFREVKGLVIGRFQKKSEMDIEKIKDIISTKGELKNIPVIANVDFGHTNPMITFPIGGRCRIGIDGKITILKH